MKRREKQHPKSASTSNTGHQQFFGRNTALPRDKPSGNYLKELADDYLAILENSISGMVVVEANTGKVLFANRTALNIFGYNSMEEVGESNLMDYVHPDDRERAFLAIAKDFFGSTSHDRYEFRAITRYGEEKRLLTLGMPIKYQRKLVGLISLVDITERKKIEDALRDSEGRLRAMFEYMAEAVLFTNMEGRVLYANPAAVKLHRYGNTQELIGAKASALIAEGDRGRIVRDGINTIKTGKPQLSECKLTTKDGTLIDGESCTAAIRDASGNPVGMIGISRDISDRKRMEDKLRENERKLQTVFNTMMDGLIITDMRGRIIDANQAAFNIGKYKSKEEMIGRNGLDIITEDDQKKIANLLSAIIADPKRMQSEVFEFSAKDKDGNLFYGESSVSVTRDNSGRPNSMIFVHRDITEHKRMEDAIRASEELLSVIFESMKEGIAVVDKDIKLIRWNKALLDISGLKAEDVMGKSGLVFLMEEDRGKATEDLVRQLKGISLLTPVYRVKLPNGVIKHIEVSVGNLKDNNGNIMGFVASIRDITERIRMERDLQKALDDLQRSNKDLEQFVYVASHDLQEPLRMVSSYTQLLGKRYKGKLDSDADEFIGFAVDGADRMQKMINDLLVFSRVTTRGKEFETVDLEKALSDALDNLKIAIEENKATITHGPLPKVVADEPQMVRLLQNIIGNAIKFHGQEPPVIHVSAKEGTKEWTVSVKDNGIGIDKKYFDRLFIIFQRLHTRDQYPGTGIGLAVCKKTVERHGGRIWVESEGAGKGSTFIFTLPKRALTNKTESAKDLQENN